MSGGPAGPAGAGGVRRSWLAAGLLVAGLLAMRAVAPLVATPTTAAPSAGPAGDARGPVPVPVAAVAARPAPLAEATGVSLLLGGDGGLLRVDIDRGRVRPVPLPVGPAEADGGLVERDGTVVAVRGGTAYATAGRPGQPAIPLGPASYAVTSARPGRVWLVEETGDPEHWFRLRGVDLGRGTVSTGARWVLPLGSRPVGAGPGGLLVHEVGDGGGLAVWDPGTGRLGRRLAAGGPLTAVAAHGRTVAWVEGAALHLGDLVTGRDRVVAPPPGSDGFAAPGAFSPDGRTLAAVTRSGFSTRPALALVAVERAAAVRVAGSDGALSDRCSPCLAWAPAGDWVFFLRLGPAFGIGAFHLGRPRAVTVPVDVPYALPPSLAAVAAPAS